MRCSGWPESHWLLSPNPRSLLAWTRLVRIPIPYHTRCSRLLGGTRAGLPQNNQDPSTRLQPPNGPTQLSTESREEAVATCEPLSFIWFVSPKAKAQGTARWSNLNHEHALRRTPLQVETRDFPPRRCPEKPMRRQICPRNHDSSLTALPCVPT